MLPRLLCRKDENYSYLNTTAIEDKLFGPSNIFVNVAYYSYLSKRWIQNFYNWNVNKYSKFNQKFQGCFDTMSNATCDFWKQNFTMFLVKICFGQSKIANRLLKI